MTVQKARNRPEPDVYDELRSLLRALGARRLIELGCGDGSALVSLLPTYEVVGVDDDATIKGCRERYVVGQWLEADLRSPYDLAKDTTEQGVILLGYRAARHDEAWRTAQRALHDGALALVVALPETRRETSEDFRRRLAQHNLDGYVGRTSFDVSTNERMLLCVVPGRDATVRETVAYWWADREPWERQLRRMADRPAQLETPELSDTITSRAGAAHITVVTEVTSDNPEALRRTATSLTAQSFPHWSWKIISTRPLAEPVDDPRVTVLLSPTRARGLAEAVSDAEFVAVVDEGVELPDTSLEKWLWFLDSHPSHPGVAGSSCGSCENGEARLYRREAIESAGGLDAAWTLAEPIGRVPYTGSADVVRQDSADSNPRATVHERPRVWVAERWPARNIRPNAARRVLLIAPWMALGGADRVNAEVLQGLRDLGWEVTIATTRRADHSHYRAFERITSDLFPLADFTPLADYPRVLDYLIDSRRPDVVLLSQSELAYRLLPYLRPRHTGSAFVDLCHSEVDDWYGGGFPRFSIEYQALLDRSIVVSHYLRDWMVARGADPNRIEVCYANVDHSRFAPDAAKRAQTRNELGIAQDERVILWVGRIADEKRPHLLPAISGSLRRGDTDHSLLVVGDGNERAAVEELAMADAEARLLFLGEVEHEKLPALYTASDVLVLPSRVDGIALVLFEAMACGVPVVAARIGGHAELVTPDVGVLVERRPEETEVNRYADALAGILNDPVRRSRMGQAARERIEESFTADVMQERIEEILEGAIAQPKSPRHAHNTQLERAIVSEAIELVRLEEIWQPPPLALVSRRTRAYALMQRVGARPYCWAKERRIPGLQAARALVRRVVLGT